MSIETNKFEIISCQEEKIDDAFFKSLKAKIMKLVGSEVSHIILVFSPGNYPIPDWFIDWIRKMRSKGVYIIIVISTQHNNMCCVSKSLFSQIDTDFKDFLFSNRKYVSKLKRLSSNLGTSFSNVSPTYWTGNDCDDKDKYVLISLNPGFDSTNIYVEDIIKNFTFYTSGRYNSNDWLNFYRNFYKLFFLNGLNSSYYTRMRAFFEGLHGLPLGHFDKNGKGLVRQRLIYDFYDKHLINMDIIPYHSERINLSLKKFSHKGLCYIANRFNDILNFIKCLKREQRVRKVILNGNIFVDLLINGRINKCSNLSISPKHPQQYPYKSKNNVIKIYWVDVSGTDMIVIDKFLTGVRGLTNKDLYNIGSFIQSKSPPGC